MRSLARLARFCEGSGLTPARVRTFRSIILGHYREHGRAFPWRETREPYAILVSEFMLQQTQTSRVERKYAPFLAEFPTIDALARASLARVLGAWQGLGYNRRARALRLAAEEIVSRHHGQVPADEAALRALPGIGQSTAAAVRAFAFGLPSVMIETNVRRVYLHAFFPRAEAVTDREIAPLVERTMHRADPRTWYYALMDTGVALAHHEGNPNRRSAHYTRQSTFEGSARQRRARVLRHLIDHGPSAPGALADALGLAPGEVNEALGTLKADGLATPMRTRWRAG